MWYCWLHFSLCLPDTVSLCGPWASGPVLIWTHPTSSENSILATSFTFERSYTGRAQVRYTVRWVCLPASLPVCQRLLPVSDRSKTELFTFPARMPSQAFGYKPGDTLHYRLRQLRRLCVFGPFVLFVCLFLSRSDEKLLQKNTSWKLAEGCSVTEEPIKYWSGSQSEGRYALTFAEWEGFGCGLEISGGRVSGTASEDGEPL